MGFKELYTSNLENPTPKGNEIKANCPFHCEDTKANKSFSANIVTGKYHCHSCDASGNSIKFAKLMGLDPTPYYDQEFIKTTIDEDEVNRFHDNLMKNPEYIRDTWDLKVLEDLKVGLNIGSEQLVFPIFNKEGKIINLKYHKGKQTIGSYTNFYPWHYLSKYKSDYVIICEGEPDTNTLLSYGFQAITGTGGANKIPPNISELMKFKKLFLCPDNDEAGDSFICKWAVSLKKMNTKIHIRLCDLSNFVNDKGDVSDYFNIPDKNRASFCSEILDKSRFYKNSYTDIPYFRDEEIKSDWYINLKPRDLIVYSTLMDRFNRYRTRFNNFNGKSIVCQPGEWIGSKRTFANYCGKGFTEQMVSGAWNFLAKSGRISRKTLPNKVATRIKILRWKPAFCPTSPSDTDKQEYSVFTTENNKDDDESGTSVKDETVHI